MNNSCQKHTGYTILHLLLLLGVWSAFSCASGKKATSRSGTKELSIPLAYEDARKYDYYFLEATRQKEKGDYAAAFDLYEHCLAVNPNSAAAMYELAQFYVFLDQPDRSRDMLERTVQLEPNNFWYRQTLGAYYRSSSDYPKAIQVYEEMTTLFPNRSEVLMILVDLYNHEKDYGNVIYTLDRLEVKEGKSEMLSMEKFRIYLQMDDKEKAFDEIEKLAQEYPNDMRYRIMLGDVYLNNGKSAEAYETYRSVLNLEPDNALVQLSLASYYEHEGQDSLFRKQLRLALDNPKLDGETRLNIVRRMIMDSEQSDRDSTKILRLFDHMLSGEQDNAAMAMLCFGYMQAKKMSDEQTKPVLDKILSIEPDNVFARQNLLMMAIRKNDYNEAVEVCEPAILYNPDELAFYYYLGISYYQTEREKKALETFRKGVEQVTDESNKLLVSDFYLMIGDLSHSLGKKEEAYAAYDSALVYNPDNVGVLNNYAYFLSLGRSDLDKAEEMSYRTIKAEPKNDTYLDTYAWILFEKGRYSEARIYIDDAMKNGGDQSAVIVEHCGDIYYMLGEKEAAMQFWRQADEMEGNTSKKLKQKLLQQKYIAE